MSDLVRVPFGESREDTATLLLEAAEKKGHGAESVRVVSDSSGGTEFEVPAEVAKAAKADTVDEEPSVEEQAKADAKRIEQENEERAALAPEPEEPGPAKKATAKKTAAKKTTSRNKG